MKIIQRKDIKTRLIYKNKSKQNFELEEKLKNYIEHQKPYLDQNFSLQNLSLILNVHPNRISMIKNLII